MRIENGLISVKFGGTSLSSAELITKVALCIKEFWDSGKAVIATVSAMGHETDRLLDLVKAVGSTDPREADRVLSTGEEVSAGLLAMALQAIGVPAKSYNACQLGLIATGQHGDGRFVKLKNPDLVRSFADQHVVVVTGFQGHCEETGDLIIMGRGSSDETSVVASAACGAEACYIYTDVDGVYAIDPRLVPNARRFDTIGYAEMLLLAYNGVGVLMDRCVGTAQKFGVTIKVLLSPSMGTSTGGSTVCFIKGDINNIEEDTSPIRGLAVMKNVGVVNISNVPNRRGQAAKIFKEITPNIVESNQGLGRTKASISMLVAEDSLSVVADQARKVKGVRVTSLGNLIKLTLVDQSMVNRSGALRRASACLSEVNVEFISSAQQLIVVAIKNEGDNLKKAATALAEEFDLVAN
ncbi:MAG: Aspartokinase [Microgenomates group bacterium GW2011_GWA2_46_7]|nr:MAG: Aspartokinase [Microgenomates group bacterium GW2011_GWA2_46_7]